MRDLTELDRYRRCDVELAAVGRLGDHRSGCFVIESRGVELRCVASSGLGWDHVSVSIEGRCPSWDEMDFVRKLFARDGETWMQLHVPEREHVNCHPYCLHLWRPQRRDIPKPPAHFVGPAAFATTRRR